MDQICAVILAAGEGKRMKSSRPKVLVEVLFKPMIAWVIDAVRGTGVTDICVVTGFEAEQLEASLDPSIEAVRQTERLGTGHAVMQAADFIARHRGGHVLVVAGDAPLMDAQNLTGALHAHLAARNAVTVISADVVDPTGYGRIVRGSLDGAVTAIVEEKDADELTRLNREINSGAYWFQADALLEALPKLRNNNRAGEYYLTDVLVHLIAEEKPADAFLADSEDVVLGANDRIQLAALSERARRLILHRHMLAGVDIPCADGVIVGPDVEIAPDTTLLPGTILRGRTRVGSRCVLGPNTLVADSMIGDDARLLSVHCYESEVGDGVAAGPFVHIRPHSVLRRGVKIGDFVEIKNSTLGEGTKVPHLTYVGDSDVGQRVNFGCGCVTVNYNGKSKERCVIGDDAFIGCNTNLLAPVRVGDRAYTGAGSTISRDVPDDALAVERAEQKNIDGWAKRHRPKDP